MTHWTEDDFTHWLYGLRTEAVHLDECPECRARAEQIAQRRKVAARAPEVPWEFLAAQRRGIYRRLERPLRDWAPVRWAASVATVAMVGVLSFALLHNGQGNIPLTNPGDDKLFSDIASIEQSNEPRAIKPIHSLFEQ